MTSWSWKTFFKETFQRKDILYLVKQLFDRIGSEIFPQTLLLWKNKENVLKQNIEDVETYYLNIVK